jgi:hypothetical protein
MLYYKQNEVVESMNKWTGTVMSMVAGAGIGAAAVGMMKNKGNGKMKQMANDFLKNDSGRTTH